MFEAKRPTQNVQIELLCISRGEGREMQNSSQCSVPLGWHLRHKPDLCTFWTSLRCLFEKQVQILHIWLGLHSSQINSCAIEGRLDSLTPSGLQACKSGEDALEAQGTSGGFHHFGSELMESLSHRKTSLNHSSLRFFKPTGIQPALDQGRLSCPTPGI